MCQYSSPLVFRAAGAAALKRMLLIWRWCYLPSLSLILSLSQRPSFVAVVVLNGSDHLVSHGRCNIPRHTKASESIWILSHVPFWSILGMWKSWSHPQLADEPTDIQRTIQRTIQNVKLSWAAAEDYITLYNQFENHLPLSTSLTSGCRVFSHASREQQANNLKHSQVMSSRTCDSLWLHMSCVNFIQFLHLPTIPYHSRRLISQNYSFHSFSLYGECLRTSDPPTVHTNGARGCAKRHLKCLPWSRLFSLFRH